MKPYKQGGSFDRSPRANVIRAVIAGVLLFALGYGEFFCFSRRIFWLLPIANIVLLILVIELYNNIERLTNR